MSSGSMERRIRLDALGQGCGQRSQEQGRVMPVVFRTAAGSTGGAAWLMRPMTAANCAAFTSPASRYLCRKAGVLAGASSRAFNSASSLSSEMEAPAISSEVMYSPT